MPRTCSRIIAASVLAMAVVGVAGCGVPQLPGFATPGSSPAPARLVAGPVTVVALGDSLTAGEGDDTGQGFVGRLTEAIAARPGRAESTLVNLGQSGWDSTMLVDGQEGVPAELATAVDQARDAVAGGTAVLATVLIGSNDIWYAYQNSPADQTSTADEDAVVATYRENLDRTVRELQDAGAVVVVGLPHDQSREPGVVDIGRLNELLPDVTSAEVDRMSELAARLARTARDVAADHGALTVDTNHPFWADQSTMADDGIHPNAAGYAELAALWIRGIEPVL